MSEWMEMKRQTVRGKCSTWFLELEEQECVRVHRFPRSLPLCLQPLTVPSPYQMLSDCRALQYEVPLKQRGGVALIGKDGRREIPP